MPAWGNTDTANNKPKFPLERQVRKVVQLNVTSTANTTDAIANTLTFAAGTTDVANAGIIAGWSVFSTNTSTNPKGLAGFFTSNTTVLGVTSNTVTLSQNISSNILSGTPVSFDKPIVRQTTDSTYNQNTILATATRIANAISSTAHVAGAGWVNVTKKTNNDGAVRYMSEVIVALANPAAANVNSGNTSTGQIFTGL